MDDSGSVASPPIIGAWRLHTFEIRSDSGHTIRPFGTDPKGSLIYSPTGRFSAQVMRTDRRTFASGDQMKGTPEEVRANYEGVVSYFGRFEFDAEEGVAIHQVEHSLFPNREGEGQKRFCEFDGGLLTVRTLPTLWGGGEVVGVRGGCWFRRDSCHVHVSS